MSPTFFTAVSLGADGQESFVLSGKWVNEGHHGHQLKLYSIESFPMGNGKGELKHGYFVDEGLMPLVTGEGKEGQISHLVVDLTRTTPLLSDLFEQRELVYDALLISEENIGERRMENAFFGNEVWEVSRDGLQMLVRLALHYDMIRRNVTSETLDEIIEAAKTGKASLTEPEGRALAAMCWQIQKVGKEEDYSLY